MEKAVSNVKTEDRMLVEDLFALSEAISQFGYPCRAATEDSLLKLNELSEERKKLIHQQLQTTLKIVQAGMQISMHHENEPSQHPERSMVEKAMEMFGMEVRDSFWDGVDKEDIVEVYSADHVQIFRTFNFFKHSSYSLLDLLVNEWFVLWERPKIIVEKMFEIAGKILHGEVQGPAPTHVPAHILREIYRPDESLGASVTRTSLVRLKMISPIYEVGSPKIAGLILHSEGKDVGSEDEAKRLSFL